MIAWTFIPLADRPFATLDYDFASEPPYSIEDEIARSDWRDAVVRVRIRCTEEQARRIDQAAIKQALLDAGAHRVWQISLDVERESRARAEGIDGTLSTADALQMWGAANAIAEGDVAALQALTAGYLAEVQS